MILFHTEEKNNDGLYFGCWPEESKQLVGKCALRYSKPKRSYYLFPSSH